MIQIKKVDADQFAEVRGFYHSMIEAMREMTYRPGWEIDIYPSPEFLKDSLEQGTLYLGRLEDGTIAAAMVVNHEYNESYDQYDWQTKAGRDEITVIHALGVHPDYARRGIAKAMVRYVIDMARTEGQKAIRLDVLSGNVPAERPYPALGFRYLHTLKMFYEDTGWTDFKLYELTL